MELWDELRTAYVVARLGTVSAAAEQLKVHRATVARHIDALEAELDTRIFQRHSRGYVPTEAGRDLLRVARAADEQFRAFAGRTRGRSAKVEGELVITSIPLVAPLVMPALAGLRATHPDATVRYEASWRIFELQYGEAHVAVRTGARPDHPDNVVYRYHDLRSGLYAHQSYLDRYGRPEDSYAGHWFVGEQDPDSVTGRWRQQLAPLARVAFASADARIKAQAVQAGIGLGFLPVVMAAQHPQLVEVRAPRPAWDVPLWLVTHVDLHWTPKVQAILGALKSSLG